MALFLGKLSHIQLGDQNRPLAHWSGCSLHIRSGRVHTIHWCKLLNHWMLQATLSSFGSSLGESWSGDAVASEHRVTCILWARWRRRRCCRNDRHLRRPTRFRDRDRAPAHFMEILCPVVTMTKNHVPACHCLGVCWLLVAEDIRDAPALGNGLSRLAIALCGKDFMADMQLVFPACEHEGLRAE